MLTQDAQSGTSIRKNFAKIKATNVKVGTFDILLDLLVEYWLIKVPEENEWRTTLSLEALNITDAFWTKSIETDEKSVIDELDTSLQILLNALPLGVGKLSTIEIGKTRYSRYYSDLCSLHIAMGNIFPSSLTKARLWNKDSDLKSLEDIIVYFDDSIQLEHWQLEIVKKLQAKSFDESFSNIYTDSFTPKSASNRDDINFLQATLFSDKQHANPPQIENLQWLVARDVQQEVEVFAGMVQTAVKEGASFDEIAVVIPRDGWYKDFLIQTFNTFNIPLSRAGQVEEYSDLGAQWIFDAFQAQNEFAAPMVFASLFSSPLMPYSLDKGEFLAGIALDNSWKDADGNIKSYILEKFSKDVQALILMIINWQDKGSAQGLNTFLKELQTIYSLLSSEENLRLHKKRYKSVLEELNTFVQASVSLEISDLISQVQPYSLQESSQREAFLNSVHVVYEDDYLLQEVKHLFVLGFNDGHYPRKLENVGVFTRKSWELLGDELNLPLKIQEQFSINAKNTFKRQLQCANESITFIASALDLQGGTIPVSSSLSDMAFCFYDKKSENDELEPEALLNYLEEEKVTPFFYAKNNESKILPNRELVSEDLQFSQNIFELRKNKDGTLRPESPSSFEKLMISPLGWFLYRQGLESKTWGVEELDVATQGTIAHGVFEDCFCPENPTHDLSNIESIIEIRIKQYAPFLAQAHRRLDYEQLRTSILKAADEFKALLIHCDASVESTERQLKGSIFDIPVAGRTDAILNIGGKQLVLDYKKSGRKGRVSRMKEGYDHQLFLYRIMLNDDEALTAYYTMNDATLVVDQEITCKENLNLNIVEIEEECTINAEALIEERIKELINGDIILNSVDDNKTWENRGVTATYSLDSSPLIKLFMKPEEII